MSLCMGGISDAIKEELGIDFSNNPPWLMYWPALWVDIICTPLQCRNSWRNYVPFGLTEPGGWWSEEFEIGGYSQFLSEPLTFEKFRSMQGYNVTSGTGLLAGLHGKEDISDWLKSLYEYTFETPSTSLSKLTTPTAMLMVFLLVLCIRAFKAVVMPQFESLGRSLAVEAHGEPWLKKNQERITKFGEYVYRLCYHSFISGVGFYLFWSAPWWNEDQGGTLNLYTDWPNDPVQPSMTWYYLMQAAYNVDAMVSLLEISFQVKVFAKDSFLPITIGWSSSVRGDFGEMLAHHIVTNALVFLSSCMLHTRIGSMVFWMHDISDVPVDLAKLANFVKWKAGTVGFFVLLNILWVHTRLWILPGTIWYSIYIHAPETGRGMEQNYWVFFYAYQPVFLILLAVLILLHFIWFTMFVKMGVVLVSKGETHDYTEHKKGEKEKTSGNPPTSTLQCNSLTGDYHATNSPNGTPTQQQQNGDGAVATNGKTKVN